MRRYLSFGGIAAVTLALLSLRCGEAIPDAEPGRPVDAAASSDAQATNPDASEGRGDATVADAGVDAPDGGDPRLARSARTACRTDLDDAGTLSLFPDYGIDLYRGQRGAVPIMDTNAKLLYCDAEKLLRVELSYPKPATGTSGRPSMGVKRTTVPDDMVVDYILESVATPNETTDDVLVGPFAVSYTGSALLVLAIAVRAPTKELAVIRVYGDSTPPPISLGDFTGPTHIRFETTAPDAGGAIAWKVTATTATSTVERSGTEIKPAAPFSLLFGATRTAPDDANIVTFSEIKLP